MQGKHLYEYAIIRVVPRVEREEFINIGIIIFSKHQKYINMLYNLDEKRLKIFYEELDIVLLKEHLESFEKIVFGKKDGGAIAKFDIPERFRWLTAVRSACIQTSRPHSGFADDLNAETIRLFNELVL